MPRTKEEIILGDDLRSLNRYYQDKKVFQTFFYRYYEIKPAFQRVLQRDIYKKFYDFCVEKKVLLASTKRLARYLRRVNGLYYAITTGNQRCWYGLVPREVPFLGTIGVGELLPWEPVIQGSDDGLDLSEPRKGRPFGGSLPSPKRPERSSLKGFPWRKLYRLYRHFEIFNRFEEEYIERDSNWMEPREALWKAFDDFCRRENVPTCSLVKLLQHLYLDKDIHVNELGLIDVKGIKLRVKS